LKKINIKPENVVGSITVTHDSFFTDSTIPYHLGFTGLFAIEKMSSMAVIKRRNSYVKVVPSDFSPLTLSMSLPLQEKKNSHGFYLDFGHNFLIPCLKRVASVTGQIKEGNVVLLKLII
jgi:hypothetical protein